MMATQNPIEQEGTYPLPEAQLDRFLLKLIVGYSTREELSTILDRTTRGERPKAEKVMDGPTLLRFQALVRDVIVAPHVQDYAIRLALATHPKGPFAAEATNQYVRWGSSPRGVQTLVLAAKVRALLDGRFNVSFEDLRRGLPPQPAASRPPEFRGPGRRDQPRRCPAQDPRLRLREGRNARGVEIIRNLSRVSETHHETA